MLFRLLRIPKTEISLPVESAPTPCRGGRLDADLASGRHEPEPTVISVFHLTHRVAVGGGHTRSLSARRPAFIPSRAVISCRRFGYLHTAIPIRGYDVSRLCHDASGVCSSRTAERVGTFRAASSRLF